MVTALSAIKFCSRFSREEERCFGSLIKLLITIFDYKKRCVYFLNSARFIKATVLLKALLTCCLTTYRRSSFIISIYALLNKSLKMFSF